MKALLLINSEQGFVWEERGEEKHSKVHPCVSSFPSVLQCDVGEGKVDWWVEVFVLF